MDNIIGRAELFIEEIFFLEWDMVKAHGWWLMEIDMMDNIWMTRKMEKEPTCGNQETNIKDSFKMTIGMVTD